MIKKAFEEINRSKIFEWHKRFLEGLEAACDNSLPIEHQLKNVEIVSKVS